MGTFNGGFWNCRRNGYPKNRPMVYVCSHNGVTGVIRADVFDDVVLAKRLELNKWDGWKNLAPFRPRFHYRQIFLFTDMNKPEVHQVVGSLDALNGLIISCAAEYRDFELPPIKAGVVIEGQQYIGGSTTIQTAPTLAAVQEYLTSRNRPGFLLL